MGIFLKVLGVIGIVLGVIFTLTVLACIIRERNL